MIKQINIEGKEVGILLGFEAIKAMSSGQKDDKSEMQIIEDVALVGFQTYAKRMNEEVPNRELVIRWFDEIAVFLEVKDAVEEFSINFTQKVEAIQKAKTKKKP